jgi:hypothetical protein
LRRLHPLSSRDRVTPKKVDIAVPASRRCDVSGMGAEADGFLIIDRPDPAGQPQGAAG